MNSRNCIVLLTGPEGAGKTTSITIIANLLRKCGYTILSPYLRSTFFPIRVLRKIFVLLGRKQVLCKLDGTVCTQPDNLILHKMSSLWYILDDLCIYAYLLLLTLHTLILTKVLRRRVLILCERFIIDTIVDQLYGSIFYKPSRRILRLSLYLLMKILYYVQLRYTFIVIVLDADIKEIVRRFLRRGYSDFLEFVYFQKRMLPKVVNITKLSDTLVRCSYIDNTSLTITDTVTRVLNIVRTSKCI